MHKEEINHYIQIILLSHYIGEYRMSMVRWLHISDLHYGYESYVTIEMRTNMIKSLPEILKVKNPPEYIFITGDLRYAKNCGNEFPGEIADSINELINELNISPNNVHIVMGNHDVTQEYCRKDIAPLVQKEYAETRAVSDDRKNTLEKSQHKFYEVYKAICEREPSPYHYFVDENNFNIICLNTAFACPGGGDGGNLIVDMNMVQEALNDIDATKPGIVLAHHGFESLQSREKEQLEIKLKESGALLYLCGHEHMANHRIIAEMREKIRLHEYVCGTGMDKLPTGQEAEMVIFSGELDTEKKEGHVQAWIWSARYGEWLPHQGFSSKQDGLKHGRNYFDQNPPQNPPKNAITPDLQEKSIGMYKKYIQHQCGEIKLDGMPEDDKIGSKNLTLEKLFIPTKLEKASHLIPSSSDGGEFKPITRSDFRGIVPFELIAEQLAQIEKGEWNQYQDEDLSIIKKSLEFLKRDILVPDSNRNQHLSQEETDFQEAIESLLSQIKVLRDQLREKNLIIPPKQSGFRRVILSGPGGGKTTLLKRLATAYAFPERRVDSEIDDFLPERELFPIWIRCRDLKEKAKEKLATIIETIPSGFGFHSNDQDIATAFKEEVFTRIEKGEVLILIDGLDEITRKDLRKSFAEGIIQFLDFHPEANIIITSRIRGFEHISGGKLGEFPLAEISHLDDEDIRLLCYRWHKVIYGDQAEKSIQDAKVLADMILDNEKIRFLARTPLLLMTLLLVKRRVGKLHTKRATLYEDSIKVLLETWNQEAHEPIDFEKAMCQLSYVAFEMMREGIQTIGKRKLVSLLKKVRKDLLSSDIESPAEFLDRVELRSSLLSKRGYRQTGSGLEEEYEFQHLTFQEYMAAFAVVKGYYRDADKEKNYLDVLKKFYVDESKEEIILLVAAQGTRKDVTHMVESIISQIKRVDKRKEDSDDTIPTLRNLLMKIVHDEAPLTEETRNQIFVEVLRDSIRSSQIPLFIDVLESNQGEKFRMFLRNNERGAPLLSAFDLQKNEDDPIDKCVHMVISGSNEYESRKYALDVLDNLLWMAPPLYTSSREDGFLENVLNFLVEIVMEPSNGGESISSASCLYWILRPGVNTSSDWIPNGFSKRLMSLSYEKRKTWKLVRLFDVLPICNENAHRLLYLDCQSEIKQFLLESLTNANNNEKSGLYWANVLTGAWRWDEAEAMLERMFAEKYAPIRDEMKKKLQIIRAAAESEEI
ncbi:MAG: metallophosphoesterase [Methanomassiliicoccaceae archaeon]|nr:metallophosphoesterase [Methanomassiliicoccaceae archaeon]